MPLYTYVCPACGEVRDEFNSIAARHKGPDCCEPMQMKIMPTQIQAQILGASMGGYQCPVSGEYVTSRVKRREIMKRHDLVEAESSSKQTERRNRVMEQTKGVVH